ncbi:UDP-N-acetylmuramoyl-L-alanyl-D-glutamate--2,6-diaminopimelate ligase [Hydrogenimonas thermophila]|uniref:UDP-N-acetylmuramoyl-L-alanyl-D-glutamate--2,6-diaminopimelate ligase n=1 Tax=Hydrogenimonas thermophila TaxID=223786 RepID=A0A1I5RC98_9BACT|nr:UDP-N-acetylmuramoyl-L-alanyl-D-glutamate--2,6-diaminopimelate ligase [Hydrogenimonas thermophila]WOE69749.1 UDP-N-acetylmuramoyl-L-alanyl-D-glutamate--2,6-diaminopimelate ligase [Hydrogenimonas thermophila]WOE72263.1 UDP-N-acetylmuramoyl-L-alanyl-D-glutamate--2,6-diaminopimelate ligase [Hydrogenimonas thermophila]SFP56060.1 UDP-N-acetylmuramoylalanyl-D-glutamate--2,6-diaminopimelate ligase [Hydrogenimonas thermophila]
MTVDFGGDIGIVTDDSREADKDKHFLVTKLNKSYIEEATSKNAKLITPKELIEKLGLNSLDVVGITGTNGKTTTAAAIYSILLDLGYKTALQGTRGLFINDKKIEDKSLTTPPSLATIYHMFEAKKSLCEFFVMEVSSHAIDQNRIEGIEFALKIHTNVTSDHLDYHKTLEEYRAVKSSFFQDSGKKLINRDEDILHFNIQNSFSYGIENPATYKIMAYTLGGGVSGVLKHFETVVPFETTLQGFFNLYNITAAIAAVHILTDEDLGEICEAAENFGGVSGRMETVSEKPLIIVDFAHTEDGIKQVLDSLKEKEVRVVFGAGGDRDRSKRPAMGRAAASIAKKVYITSDNPRSEDPAKIIDEIAEGIKEKDKIEKIVDRKEAIKKAIDELEDGEVLLVLGKGDEAFQEINGTKIPFDDREVIREILNLK